MRKIHNEDYLEMLWGIMQRRVTLFVEILKMHILDNEMLVRVVLDIISYELKEYEYVSSDIYDYFYRRIGVEVLNCRNFVRREAIYS